MKRTEPAMRQILSVHVRLVLTFLFVESLSSCIPAMTYVDSQLLQHSSKNQTGFLALLLGSSGSTGSGGTSCGPQYSVTTIAGGVDGFQDGTGNGAQFSSIWGVAADLSGNLYVADSGNNAIRKITPDGVVSTIAGGNYPNADYGFQDGPGSAALFNGPHALAVDSSGNVYVADTGNHAIRMVTPGGVVSTIAGGNYPSGTSGFVDGLGNVVRFNEPDGVALDAAGNIYVADALNFAIRTISGGNVTTLAGGSYPIPVSGFKDGAVSSAQFAFPHGVAVPSSGTVYVIDQDNNAVRRISAGSVTTLAGGNYPSADLGFQDGLGNAALFSGPHALAVDPTGNVYVADSDNNAIRMVTPFGVVSTIAGGNYPNADYGFQDGPGNTALFDWPHSVTVDSSGNIYVADTGNFAIRKICP